ncbi:MAG: SMP-30/gluconolactonase/LRE family protein [Reyranellaceae bacterium]
MAGAGTLETILDGLTFGEGPRWHDGRLWFSDFYTHSVIAMDPAGRTETMATVPQQPSGLGWMPDGTLLVVSMLDQKLMKRVGGRLVPHADLSAHAVGPCNDMVVDAKGRAWVGNFGFDLFGGEAARTTCIVRVDPDGGVTRAADDLAFPNGSIVTPDGRTLVIGETRGNRLTAFDIATDGALSNRRVWAQFDDVFPDGICLDAEGAIWVADPRGRRVVRVFEGSRIDRVIELVDRGAYACMLGGDDRRTLYVVTNSASGPNVAAAKAGRIEAIRVDVPGAGLP